MRIAIIFLSLTISSVLNAQQKLNMHIGWKGNGLEMHSISNKKQAYTFLLSSDSLKIMLLYNGENIKDLITVERKWKDDFYGGFIQDESICFFLGNPKGDSVHCYRYTPVIDELKENMVGLDLQYERVINKLSFDNYFCFFTVNPKTSMFGVYKFKDENSFDTAFYKADEEIASALKNNDGDVFKKASMTAVEVTGIGECDVDIAQSPRKVYLKGDTLLLLLNTTRGITNVYSIDMVNKKMDHRFIEHEDNEYSPTNFVFNSFLLDDKIYYASASYDNLFLQVNDFFTGASIKQFKALKDEPISFKNTAITQEGTASGAGGIKVLDKTRQLLRKMSNSNLLISAMYEPGTNRIVVSLGSYEKLTGGGGMPMSGGIPIGGSINVSTAFSRGGWTKSAHFKTLLTSPNYDHVAGSVPMTINERIEQFTAGLKIADNAENLFQLNGKYYYAYYNKSERSFVIAKF